MIHVSQVGLVTFAASLHETSWHSFLDSHHYLDLELKVVYRDNKRKSQQQLLRHWIKKLNYFEQDKVDNEKTLSE